MTPDSGAAAKSPSPRAVVLATLLATLSLSAATASAQQAREAEAYGSPDESAYYTDQADAGFFDFSDDELADVEEDMFNFEAEYGQDYDEQLVSHQTSYEYQQEGNVYETDEAWFEDWLDEE